MNTMIELVRERTPAYALSWSFSAVDGAAAGEPTFKLEYELDAFEELYVGDRLWVLDRAGKRVPDPFGVYRFVAGESLRLVFARPPVPPNVMPRVVFQPLFSRVGPGETRRNEVLLKAPIDEYSALGRDIHAETVLEEVSKVILVLSYRLRSTMDKDPVPPPFESPDEAGYIVSEPELIISTLAGTQVPVKRRTGYIARFPLPGEPGPGPAPLPA
ncbi:hypothetical protein [Nannocystis pusilla]|uniref:Uncharacterized protein n=1 Tax=Nannocystis pusilla TaxID=889268 RepID=A0ABS7TWR7_9BACT|nr:hypothetical protein [Nannocystis pusilla]MBZ5712702.1 hypothetical protein [Nannocystis pusilla]